MVEEAHWTGLWDPNMAFTRAARILLFYALGWHIILLYSIWGKKGRKNETKRKNSPDIRRLSKQVLQRWFYN